MPDLIIDMDAINYNLITINDLCHKNGIGLTVITKCLLSNPHIINQFYEEGIEIIGDTRLENLSSLSVSKEEMIDSIIQYGFDRFNEKKRTSVLNDEI